MQYRNLECDNYRNLACNNKILLLIKTVFDAYAYFLSAYNASEFDKLDVSQEIKDLFNYISR